MYQWESGGYSEENQTGHQVMRVLIMLEQTGTGFAVQAPDWAIATYGENIEAAKRSLVRFAHRRLARRAASFARPPGKHTPPPY
jgi:hypothetical protein